MTYFTSFRKRVQRLNQKAPSGKSASYFTAPLHFMSRRFDDVQTTYINFNLFLTVHNDALSFAAVINIAYCYTSGKHGKIWKETAAAYFIRTITFNHEKSQERLSCRRSFRIQVRCTTSVLPPSSV
jgi:hypothetical protein